MAVGRGLVLLFLQVGCFKCDSAYPRQNGEKDIFNLTMLMPDAVANKADTLVCTARQLGPEEAYIVKITPHASMLTVHHLVVLGCAQAGSNLLWWVCDQGGNDGFPETPACAGGKRQMVFSSALDAPGMDLPAGTGIRISGSTEINYLVVQLHYAHAFAPGETDNSGITLELTYTRPPQQVAYLGLGILGTIPPQISGVVTSGYSIRQGKWSKIGKMSPQRPQAFYEVSHPGMDIRKGDILAARCVMDSRARTTVTKIGPTNHDEMCYFSIVYSTFEKSNLKSTYFYKNADRYSWLHSFKPEEIPQDSVTLDGVPGAQEIIDKFNSLAISG